jgi:hypothetical protein
MSRTGAWSILLTAVIAVMVCSRSPAQDAISAGLRACVKETDDAVRLKCYDSEMRRILVAPVASAAAQSGVTQSGSTQSGSTQSGSNREPEAAPIPEMTPEQAFGYRGAIAREQVDRRDEQRSSLEKLEAIVAKVDRKPLGELVLTLANGQVWTQKAPDPHFKAKAGDAVTIRRGSLGSFMMVVSGGRSTQVARVK